MNQQNAGDLQTIVIDFSEARTAEGQINESFLATFGWAVKSILKRMFGDIHIPVEVRGNPSEIRAFASALGSEKRYLQSYKDYGLNDPRTYKNKAVLKNSVSKFEKTTGIKWPFK